MTYSENLFYGASPEIHRRAKELRKQMTPAEKILWELLKEKSLGGYKFRRQHPINKFIADFYCHELGLVIELDGSVHDSLDQTEYDSGRTYELEELGLKVIRFKNDQVINELFKVLEEIRLLLPHPGPPL
ncbi:Very-short-patch-repair endonuclease [Algoriphagus alkaliphilus]|uniref:Very-short-patch-repair endonuclease n=1 Tax=Algoriphagus alkaliphilus TaxID=279824 RepID=A0A1G5ZNE5_9BACT|nr:endonuclease domain-containing protein [Algoriphagus alkaliphilus]MBA4301930.1 endonuclease domain-containing protein [Cyclobacterium sp.]SDA96321.1 Very-short-patch-repair endonuclease [Algoriphagus alkaliphilus]